MRIFFIIISICFGFFYAELFLPASNFPVSKPFIIKKGDNERVIYQKLEDSGYIRSAFLAESVSKIFSLGSIQIGEYVWNQKTSTWLVVTSLRIKPKSLKITIPEGFTKYQIAEKFSVLQNFDKTEFLFRANEGYLFPETYYVYNFTSTNEILEMLEEEYNSKIENAIQKNILKRKPTKEDIIIASLLEREAKNLTDMKLISGVIQNRLAKNMPLQIDASVLYGLGTWKDKTNLEDLKSVTGYNTYINKGLPVGAISNPGILSISAAQNPTNSKYLYYLTGKNGVTYYNTNLEGHNKAKSIYLK